MNAVLARKEYIYIHTSIYHISKYIYKIIYSVNTIFIYVSVYDHISLYAFCFFHVRVSQNYKGRTKHLSANKI